MGRCLFSPDTLSSIRPDDFLHNGLLSVFTRHLVINTSLWFPTQRAVVCSHQTPCHQYVPMISYTEGRCLFSPDTLSSIRPDDFLHRGPLSVFTRHFVANTSLWFLTQWAVVCFHQTLCHQYVPMISYTMGRCLLAPDTLSSVRPYDFLHRGSLSVFTRHLVINTSRWFPTQWAVVCWHQTPCHQYVPMISYIVGRCLLAPVSASGSGGPGIVVEFTREMVSPSLFSVLLNIFM